MRIRGLVAACLAGGVFLSASLAAAQEELKNDGFVDGQSAGFQSGFLKGEAGASRFTPSNANVALLKVQFLFGGQMDGAMKDVTLHVWDDTDMTDDPGNELYSATYSVTAADMALQEIDVSSKDIVVPGTFRVGVEFTYDGLPSIARDNDDTIDPDVNFILANGTTWKKSADLGVTGDWIIRAFVENGSGGTGGGGAGGATSTGGSGGSGASSTGGSTTTTGLGGSGGSGGDFTDKTESSGGDCGCRAAGSAPSNGGVLAFAMMAVAACTARRRRRGPGSR